MSPRPGMKGYKTVDDYVAAAPIGIRAKLEEVRKAIKDAAPDAKESISYGMPYYAYKGRMAWFGLFTEHIGLFVRPPVLEDHKDELKGYKLTKSSLHLPIGEKIPTSLVKKLIRAAVKRNDEESSA